ncbi:MAG: SufE family protein [Verrucomicrobiales bacterium]
MKPARGTCPRFRRDGARCPAWVNRVLPALAEEKILEDLAVLPDPQERLAHLMERATRRPPVPEKDRNDTTRVPGCVSRVWLTATLVNGQCRFQVAANSPMVLGLVRFICDVYDGAPPAEAAAFQSEIITRSGLHRFLSPTRLHGLDRTRHRIRALAASLSTPPSHNL